MLNASRGITEKPTRLLRVQAATTEEVETISAGDIGAIVRLDRIL